jgi:cell wall-active antibiotic response 4TMS protein YvqF
MSSEAKVVGYCRACGKALDETTVHTAQGTIYCAEHVPAQQPPPIAAAVEAPSPYTSATPPPVPNLEVSPAIAFLLGMIPGVGAIYNGQYIKGLVHVVILGLMISILHSDAAGGMEALLGMMLSAFWFYMAFEAYHTAKKRRMGLAVDDFSSLVPATHGHGKFPAAPILLIALGAIFLLNNLGVVELRRMLRYWPILLIVLGVYMLYIRVAGAAEASHGGK